MELKALTDEDRAAITTLFKDVFTNAPWNDDWSDPGQLDAYITDLTGHGNSLTLGWLDGDRLAGVSMGHIKHWYTGTKYYIDEFCVARAYQRQGVGSAFMRAIEEALRERGVAQIFLQTERAVPAYAFYRRMGFQELPEHVSFTKRIL